MRHLISEKQWRGDLAYAVMNCRPGDVIVVQYEVTRLEALRVLELHRKQDIQVIVEPPRRDTRFWDSDRGIEW